MPGPRAKPAPVLMNHRTLAAMIGMSTRTVTDWIERGNFPNPHARVGVLYFYRTSDVQHFIDKGRWPASMCKPIGG